MNTSIPTKALRLASNFWFLVALVGLWLFVYYLVGLYGLTAVSGELDIWSKVSLKGYVPGDLIGNIMFAAHIFLAVIISIGGVLQLVPVIRNKAPSFHRWNGRLFVFCILAISIGGLYLTWIRGASTSTTGAVGLTLNALLIFWFSVRAINLARSGNYNAHRLWALRTFIVANGVWFFRVGLFAWIIANQGPVGIGENFDGPFVKAWSFLNYLLPLAFLELYLFAQRKGGNVAKSVMTFTLVVATLFMAAGIFGAFMFMWLPELQR